MASICEKLQALEQLVEQQLSVNYIASTINPWISPDFVIEKKSGKWRMLTDLRKINAIMMGFPGGSEVKASACNTEDLDSIPGLGRFPGERNGNPLQYSCLENPMDRGAWWATVHRVAKSQAMTE